VSRIVFDGISHRFGATTVLDRIDLELTEARIGLVGANGSGKSTLARMVNGLITPTAGRVSVDGVDPVRDGRTVRRRVGFVFTNPDSQIVMPTVAEDVAFSLRRSGLDRPAVTRRVTETLARFGLAGLADHPTHLLSGGQKQLLAVAAVLVTEPAVLVADEPTTLLDLRNARMMTELFATLPQQLLLVTHQIELLTDFDRVVVLERGRVAADGSPARALATYQGLLA